MQYVNAILLSYKIKVYWPHVAVFKTLRDENNDVAAIDFCNTFILRPYYILSNKAWRT